MTVSVLGLGIIGSRAAELLSRDPTLKLTVWNRTPGRHPQQAESIAEAVEGKDVASLYVGDSAAVRETATAMQGFFPKGATLINHATVDPATTQWLATTCKAEGWTFLEAPFTGSRDAAAAGTLVYYTSGPPHVLDLLEPFLLKTGRLVIRCGKIGNATILKLVTNLITACTVQALSEALAIAENAGISAGSLAEAVAANACGSPLAAMKIPTMADRDFEPHFSLKNMLKDSRYVLELAGDLDTPAIHMVSKRMAALCDDGQAEKDFSVLATLLAKT